MILFVFVPRSHKQLREEDRTLESVSAALFLCSTIVAAAKLSRRRDFPRWYMIVPILGLTGFLDELSFGERHFDFPMPTIAGKKVDGIHDLVDMAYEMILQKTSETAANLLLALVIMGLVGILVRYRREISVRLSQHPPLPYLVLTVFLLVPAVLIDMHLFGKSPLHDFLEELLEFNVALSLIFAGIAIGFASQPMEEA